MSRDLLGQSSNALGSFGGGNYGSYSSGYGDYCDNGISIGLLLTALLGIGVMFFTLFTKITMLTGRRRRAASEDQEALGTLVDKLQDVILGGNKEA
jgi:hypothetical protein